MTRKVPARWNLEVDVVVLGSGAAGLSAAVAAHDNGSTVALLEKATMFGGTTGVSGGLVWAPFNKHMGEVGAVTNRERLMQTLKRLSMETAPDWGLVEQYVDSVAGVIEYLESHTPLKMYAIKWQDRYPTIAGETLGHSLDCLPFDAKELGPWAEKLRRSHTFPPLTVAEGGMGGQIDYALLGKRYEEDIRTFGSGLVAALFKGLVDREVMLMNETRARELVVNDNGEVVGVETIRSGESFLVGARQGVILGTGGFEWNRELTRSFLPMVVTHPLTPPSNEGDGLLMAMDVGALLGNMTEAWWTPAYTDPTMEYDGKQLNMIRGPRGAPASIIVNRYGKRFMVESGWYNDITRAFAILDPVAMEYPNQPAWNIFDHTVKSTNPILSTAPDDPAPDWMTQAPTIRELAGKIGVDAAVLQQTVERWNKDAQVGFDSEFSRHLPWTDNPSVKHSVLRPLQVPPFYALPVYPGAIGTKGGPRHNSSGQVLNVRREPIPGLYVAGNAAAGVLGIAYPAAGGTIGPALTFGFLAGKAAAQERRRF